uniref:RxLR effector protein n=1 Tax=Hyaloperonospora arabidopsidis (strain Emoy2) TaxID=559515 RepID=M4BLX7_HYAAE
MRVSYLPAVAALCLLASNDAFVAASKSGKTLKAALTSPVLSRRLLGVDIANPVNNLRTGESAGLTSNDPQAKKADNESEDSSEHGKDDSSKDNKVDSSDDNRKSGKACI